MKYKAYLFDVQGTLLDFFTPVHAAVSDYLFSVGAPQHRAGDMTRAWRADYFRRCSDLSQTVEHWTRVQDVYVDGFISVCVAEGVPVPDLRVAELVAASWQELVPWPDTPEGLMAVRSSALTATLSNTDMHTMINIFKGLDITWDAILSAEVFGKFKPDPVVYLRALRFLDVEPHDAAMVACHPYDLRAAAGLGLGTVFVHRPMEYGVPELAHDAAEGEFDQRVSSIVDIS